MTIDTPVVVGSVTISGKVYPIYGTSARATEYFGGSLEGDVFTGAAILTQQRSLVTARRWIDRQNFKLEKTGGDSQFTAFPRDGDTLVPLGVEFAQYELASVLIEDPSAFESKNTGSNQKRLRAGPAEVEFFSRTDGGSSSLSSAGVFPPQALDLIGPYLESGSSLITAFVGGTENVSNVLGVDEYGITDPL